MFAIVQVGSNSPSSFARPDGRGARPHTAPSLHNQGIAHCHFLKNNSKLLADHFGSDSTDCRVMGIEQRTFMAAG